MSIDVDHLIAPAISVRILDQGLRRHPPKEERPWMN
jgi:hypothetical protein